MAETATDSGKTLGVSKHTWEIIGIAVAGGAVLYFGYRWYSNRSSAKTTGSLSGTVTPLAVTGAVGTTSVTPTSGGPLTTMDSWINSIVSSTPHLTAAVLFNAVNAWQNGTAVTATAYAAISKALRNGIPSWAKGYPLHVAKTATTTTATTPLGSVGQTLHGVGFGFPTTEHTPNVITITGATGGIFSWLPDATSVRSAISNGTDIFYEPTPGTFTKINPQTFTGWGTTPIYVAKPKAAA